MNALAWFYGQSFHAHDPEPVPPDCVYCDDTGVLLVCDCHFVHTCCAPEDRPADCELDSRGRLVAPCDCTKEGT